MSWRYQYLNNVTDNICGGTKFSLILIIASITYFGKTFYQLHKSEIISFYQKLRKKRRLNCIFCPDFRIGSNDS